MNLGLDFKTGDWLTMLAGVVLVTYLFFATWDGSKGASLIIRSGGKIVAQTDLSQNKDFEISGPLGMTLITVNNHRVRVARDPSPRQHCVRQGWLTRAGDSALCLPNQISVELLGATKLYDSLSY
ncbi:MAG: NusG domain II-containing protein [Sulfurimicrobium sp.]|nr:NusG domain II-containing protein [Sulfurimicrobium sp.]MDP2198260.1 NusG domain II-containing protein [Sulfurimicrobium sp.]MDP2964213.1 NusG domain II-containing protein [Sulfurimicrobium sp.]